MAYFSNMGAHHDHHHHHCNHENRSRVGFAAVLTGLFMIAEVIGGLISGSLALLADAGHMLTDFAALAMAWGAFTIARRPANWKHTFGFDRLSVLVAFVNGLTLFAIAVWIVIEALRRFQNPGEILAGPMFWVAVAGLGVNLIVFAILRGADQDNLNVRGAVLHVIGDLLGSLAAILAALIIMRTGWMLADPILSVLVALLILRSAYALIKDSSHILLEGAPSGLDRREIRQDLLSTVEGLSRVEHMHIWSLTQARPMMTLNVIIEPDADPLKISRLIKERLESRFHIDHSTIEVSQTFEFTPKAPCGLQTGG